MLEAFKRFRKHVTPVKVDILGGRGADTSDAQVLECICENWPKIEEMLTNSFSAEDREADKDELMELFNTLIPGHDNLGDILFGDIDAFRNETNAITDAENLKLYIDALTATGIVEASQEQQ